MTTLLMLLLIVAGLVLVPCFPLVGTVLIYAGFMLQKLAALDEAFFETLLGTAAGAGALATVLHGVWAQLFTA